MEELDTVWMLKARIAELEAALRKIAAVTYGTEINDTDAEKLDHFWKLLCLYQTIARTALPTWADK